MRGWLAVAGIATWCAVALLTPGCTTGGAGSDDGSGDSALPPLGSIVGTVTFGGEPAAGVDVTAQVDQGVPVSGDPVQYGATTTADGTFSIGNLPPGTYAVTATTGTLAGVRGGVPVVARAATTITVDLTATGKLSGKVTRGATTGNAGIIVWIPSTSLTAVAGDDGAYGITAPVGTYTVMATYPGYSVAQKAGQSVSAGATTVVPDLTISQTSNTLPQIATISASPIQVQGGGTSSLRVSATDADGDTLTYTWGVGAGAGSITGSGSTVTYTAPGADGNYLVTVQVSDGKGGIVSGAIAVTVKNPEPPNSSPEVTELEATVSDAAPGQAAITATATAVDSDGDDLLCLWSATGGAIAGSGGTIPDGDGTNSITWTAPQATGTYSIFCTVSDGRGGAAQGGTTVTVSETDITVW